MSNESVRISFEFAETAEGDPVSRHVSVDFSTKHIGLTWMEITERYVEFLRGIGYVINRETIQEFVAGKLCEFSESECCSDNPNAQSSNPIKRGQDDWCLNQSPRDYTGATIGGEFGGYWR